MPTPVAYSQTVGRQYNNTCHQRITYAHQWATPLTTCTPHLLTLTLTFDMCSPFETLPHFTPLQAFYALTSRLGVNPSILLSPALQKYLKPVVYYHMAKGVFKTTDLKVNKVLNTLNQDGKTLKVIGNSK